VGFEHGHGILGLRLAARNVTILMKNRVAPQKRKNPLAIMWTERFAVTQRTSNEMAPGKSQESGSTQWRGDTPMPVFTFEKLSPPARRVANAPAADKKQRGVLSSMLNRLAEARGKRSLRKERTVSARKKPKS
jgi:hypothetical protein